jgi:hypothetical protein
MALEKGETTPLFAVFGLTAHPSDDRDGDGARFSSASCGRRDGMRRQESG